MIDRSHQARLAGVFVLFSMLTACGGGSSGTTSSAGPVSNSPPVVVEPPTQPTIQGVATPSSVAVVTATNAN